MKKIVQELVPYLLIFGAVAGMGFMKYEEDITEAEEQSIVTEIAKIKANEKYVGEKNLME